MSESALNTSLLIPRQPEPNLSWDDTCPRPQISCPRDTLRQPLDNKNPCSILSGTRSPR